VLQVTRIRVGVIASGRGSNLQALIDASRDGRMAAEVGLVLSDRADAAAIGRARDSGIPALCIDPETKKVRLLPEVEARYVAALKEHRIEWVVLAGFFRIVGATLLDAYVDRVLNIHPSLLPAFPGLDAQGQAFEHGAKITGCTVHLVDVGVDTGPILAQAAVPVLDHDSKESLTARILEAEHTLLVGTIDRIARVGFTREGRKVRWHAH
jgi:phosphoribosylglycinamide formyltransferase-1